MSKLYIWKCSVDKSSHTKAELVYFPSYSYTDSYVVVAETAAEALYSFKARCMVADRDDDESLEQVLEYVHDQHLPITEAEHKDFQKKVAKWRDPDGIYPVRWNWVAEQVTPYIGDKYQNGDVLCWSYNAA